MRLERQLPGHVPRRGQSQAALQGQGPGAFGPQGTLQLQGQAVAAQAQAFQLQAIGLPVRHQFELLQLVVAIEEEAPDAHFSQLQGQRQAQLGQADGPGIVLGFRRRQVEADAVAGQLIDAQGAAQQAGGRPVQQRRVQLQAGTVLTPGQARGAPATAELAGEAVHLQPRHPPQRPAPAGLAEQQDDQQRQHADQGGGQAREAELEHAPHSSGPMEKWMR
ncbi:hypothetical protein D3C85_1085250 [compost metagenome]